jgi:tetratricopeptide (TPR) repeat protein
MSERPGERIGKDRKDDVQAELLGRIKARFESQDLVRRGVCLINAGQYEQAEAVFRRATESGYGGQSLPSYIAACLLGQGKPDAAADQFAKLVKRNGFETAARIRHALARWAAGACEEAMQSLREGIRLNSECAALHFQLGTLLSSVERYDEAELRFTQALNIERDHVEAHVSLAMCCGARNAPDKALSYLQRAQSLRPWDARLGLLLTQAAKAAQQQGLSARARAEMPNSDDDRDEQGIDELARAIEADPDFVDAFLSLQEGQVDARVFGLLLKTLEAALRRQPEHAELHHQRGRVLARLGRCGDAIDENERAVGILPTFIRALIELAKLYQQTDRTIDAATRLEQAVAAGAEYADVYYLLGNLYRKQGKVGRARSAYRHALLINNRFEAAVQALEALPVS